MDDEELGIVAQAAFRVQEIASGFLRVEEEAKVAELTLQKDLDDLLSGLVLDDLPAANDLPDSTTNSSIYPSSPSDVPQCKRSTSPSVDDTVHAKSYAWLLAHLSNPYPAAPTKARLAAHAGLTPKAMADWFANARRRIGWSALCKRHFANDRCAMIDAAASASSRKTRSLLVYRSQRRSSTSSGG